MRSVTFSRQIVYAKLHNFFIFSKRNNVDRAKRNGHSSVYLGPKARCDKFIKSQGGLFADCYLATPSPLSSLSPLKLLNRSSLVSPCFRLPFLVASRFVLNWQHATSEWTTSPTFTTWFIPSPFRSCPRPSWFRYSTPKFHCYICTNFRSVTSYSTEAGSTTQRFSNCSLLCRFVHQAEQEEAKVMVGWIYNCQE